MPVFFVLSIAGCRTRTVLNYSTSPQERGEREREREREIMRDEPSAKRPKTAPSAGGEALSLPRSRMLHQTMLVVLFLVRVGVRSADAVSKIGRMVQAHVDRAFHKYHRMISSKLDRFQVQIDDLNREMRQLTRICSNRYANRETRKGINQEHAAGEGSNTSTNTQLHFLNALRQPVYTNKNIRAEDNAGIKVAMFEGNTKVTSGLLSGVKIEILVLRGDFCNNCRANWTEEEFNKHIVQGRDGKDLVLGSAFLTNGEVELNHIRFTEGSCRTPSRKFIVAARVCKNEEMPIRVHEAIMVPVTVLDRRNEPNKKSHPPRLYDDVYRLEKIAKGGDYHQRLQEAKIFTVEDFLKALNRDPDNLCKVLKMKRQSNAWLKLTDHARQYIVEDRQELKACISGDGKVMLFFNCVYDLVGAVFSDKYVSPEQYIASGQFDSHQKIVTNKLKGQAYNYNILDNTDYMYVMKGNIPELICTANDFPHDEINHVTQPSYPIGNYHPTTTAAFDLIAPYCEGTQTQQQTVTHSIVPQQNPECLMQASYPIELASTQRFQQDGSSGVSTPSQLISEHHLSQLHQTMPITFTEPAWPTVLQAQLWSDEDDLEAGCSVFPGSSGYINQ